MDDRPPWIVVTETVKTVEDALSLLSLVEEADHSQRHLHANEFPSSYFTAPFDDSLRSWCEVLALWLTNHQDTPVSWESLSPRGRFRDATEEERAGFVNACKSGGVELRILDDRLPDPPRTRKRG